MSESPSRVDGYSRPSRSNASPRKRSSAWWVPATAARPRGSSSRSAVHAAPAWSSAARVTGVARGVCDARELGRVELAETAEVSDPEVLADADQRHPAGVDAELAQPREHLDELELVVEIGLEPEHDIAAGARGERRVPLLQTLAGSRRDLRARPRRGSRHGHGGARRRALREQGPRAARRATGAHARRSPSAGACRRRCRRSSRAGLRRIEPWRPARRARRAAAPVRSRTTRRSSPSARGRGA